MTTSSAREPGVTPATPDRPPFRGDIDGLRALAIVVVVAFHAGLPYVGGGFVGVDVFLVISGFLITRNLLADASRDGSVALASFWAKRLRRLVPALALMVAVTLVASAVLLPVIDLPTVARQGGAAALYVSNVLFALQASDYFGAELAGSPFLHTWSLGVEEQFYVVWPLVLAGVVALVGRRRPLARSVAAVFAVLAASSFVLGLLLTRSASPWAFYGLPSRAWEFAVGGLLATLPTAWAIRRGAVATGTAIAGLALILAATLVYDDTVPYPGARALVPVVGTALVIAAGMGASGRLPAPSRLLAAGPLQWTGRVSYSWYLWHWPFMVLAAAAIEDRVWVRTVAGLVALPVAALTYARFETPVRFRPALVASRRRTFAAAAAVTVGVVLVAAGTAVYGSSKTGSSDLDQMLAAARDDQRADLCEQQATSPSGISYCVGGAVGGDRTVLLVGDSHARHWKPGLVEAARGLDIRVADLWVPRCSPIDIDLQEASNSEDCQQLRRDLPTLIDELDPAAVVLSQSGNLFTRIVVDGSTDPTGPQRSAAWEEAVRSWVADLEADGRRVALIHDNPTLDDDPVDCVAREREPERCAVERQRAERGTRKAKEAERLALQEFPDVPTFDVTDAICDANVCRVARADHLIYVDTNHLSREFTRAQREPLTEFLQAALDGRGADVTGE